MIHVILFTPRKVAILNSMGDFEYHFLDLFANSAMLHSERIFSQTSDNNMIAKDHISVTKETQHGDFASRITTEEYASKNLKIESLGSQFFIKNCPKWCHK